MKKQRHQLTEKEFTTMITHQDQVPDQEKPLFFNETCAFCINGILRDERWDYKTIVNGLWQPNDFRSVMQALFRHQTSEPATIERIDTLRILYETAIKYAELDGWDTDDFREVIGNAASDLYDFYGEIGLLAHILYEAYSHEHMPKKYIPKWLMVQDYEDESYQYGRGIKKLAAFISQSTTVEQIQSQRKDGKRLYDMAVKAGHRHLQGTIVFVIDEVVNYVAEQTQNFYDTQIGVIRFPFERMFFEWAVLANEKLVGLSGIYLKAISENSIEVEIYIDHNQSVEKIKCGCIKLNPAKMANGFQLDEGVFDQYAVMDDFFISNKSLSSHPHYQTPETWNDFLHAITIPTIYALMSIVFMNTQSIEITDHEPYIHPKLAKRHGTKPTKFKMLHIKPERVQYERLSEPKEYQGIMPKHNRRGHWRHTENHPIAQLNGTRWIPATVVGEKKNGTVVKDYNVKPPKSE